MLTILTCLSVFSTILRLCNFVDLQNLDSDLPFPPCCRRRRRCCRFSCFFVYLFAPSKESSYIRDRLSLTFLQQWGTAGAESKVPSVENQELGGSSFQAWSRSVL